MKIRLSTNCIHPPAFHQEMRHPRFDQGASVGGVTSLSWLNSLDLREHPSHAILYKGVFLFKWLDRTILFYVVWIYGYTVAGNQYETLKESKPDTIDDDTHFLWKISTKWWNDILNGHCCFSVSKEIVSIWFLNALCFTSFCCCRDGSDQVTCCVFFFFFLFPVGFILFHLLLFIFLFFFFCWTDWRISCNARIRPPAPVHTVRELVFPPFSAPELL